MAKAAKAVPQGYHTITPTLTLDDAAKTIEWYKQALGAEEISRSVGPDGKIMHAEIKIGDSRVMMNDVMMGGRGPQSFGGSPASLWLYVENSDTLFNRAVSAGAKVQMPLENQFWGDRAGAVARSCRLHLVDCDAQGRLDARGNAAARVRVLQADGPNILIAEITRCGNSQLPTPKASWPRALIGCWSLEIGSWTNSGGIPISVSPARCPHDWSAGAAVNPASLVVRCHGARGGRNRRGAAELRFSLRICSSTPSGLASRQIVGHFKDHPAFVGYQIHNETSPDYNFNFSRGNCRPVGYANGSRSARPAPSRCTAVRWF